MHIINALSKTARDNLRNNMHHVAVKMAAQDGFQLAVDEVTIKEAAYLIGTRVWKTRLEKRAMLDGLLSLRRLGVE